MGSPIERECSRSITEWGGLALNTQDATVCPKCGHTIVPTRGRPDLLCTLGTYGFAVEVKGANRSFPFNRFTPEQREWAMWYVLDRGGTYLIWLSMGTRVGAKRYPRRTWLIPLRDFLAAEAIVQQYQESIPYEAGKGYNTEMQLKQIDAVNLFRGFELTWTGGGVWQCPEIHPLKDEINHR